MKKIIVTGGKGMVGRHLQKYIPDALYLSTKGCDYNQNGDLRDSQYAKWLVSSYTPDIIIHLAAKVGGIQDNINKPADYINDNLLINTNIIKAAFEYKVPRFIGILSSCAYPSIADRYPMVEEQLYEGTPWIDNIGYGYTKRCLALQIDSYNKQYGTKWNYIIPCNLYSEFDNFEDAQKMHFVTSLLYKIKNSTNDELELLGDGTALRQFMYADDLARIIKLTVYNDITDNFNIGYPENLSINDMAEQALSVTDNNYKITYKHPELKGQPRKDISNSRLERLFPEFEFTPFKEGIKKVYNAIK